MHGDLKPPNIFLHQDPKSGMLWPILGDYDRAGWVGDPLPHVLTELGSPYHAAPEVLLSYYF